MSPRIFKRKSTGTSVCNSESSSNIELKECSFKHLVNENKQDDSNSTIKIPNRVFIGGLSSNTDEWDIRAKFSKYGYVKFVKIIKDYMGISKGYGFITFGKEQEAKSVIEADEIILKGRKLNIGPALKRCTNLLNQHSNRTYSGESVNKEKNIQHNYLMHTKYSSDQLCGNIPYMFNATECVEETALLSIGNYDNAQIHYALLYGTIICVPHFTYQHPIADYVYSPSGSYSNLVPVIAIMPPNCHLNAL